MSSKDMVLMRRGAAVPVEEANLVELRFRIVEKMLMDFPDLQPLIRDLLTELEHNDKLTVSEVPEDG